MSQVNDVVRLIAAGAGCSPDVVGEHHNLQDLGLDSVRRIAFHASCSTTLGVQVPLIDLAQCDTVADVVRLVAASPRTSTDMRTGPQPIPTSPADAADLTPVQAAYWVGRGEDYDLGGVSAFWFNEYRRQLTPGDDAAALISRATIAWRRVVAHHDMLRSVVDRTGRQYVAMHDVRSWEPDVIDLSGAVDADAELRALRSARSHQVRDAATWPLFDVAFVHMPGNAIHLLVGFDVLMLDYVSWGTLMRQWGELVAHPHRDLPATDVTFYDHVAHLNSDEHRRQVQESAAWWASRDVPAAPALAGLEPQENAATARFVRHQRRIPAEQWKQVCSAADNIGVSVTAVVAAAFSAMIQHRQSAKAFSVNLTLFDRPVEYQDVVGDFTTTGLLAIGDGTGADFTQPTSFANQVKAVQESMWDVVAHRHAAPPSESGASWPVVFTSALGADSADHDTWWGDRVFSVSQTPQVALDHLVWAEHGDLVLTYDIRIDACDETAAINLLDAETRLITSLANDAAWHTPGLTWDPAGDTRALDERRAPCRGALVDRWLATAPTANNRPAVTDGTTSITHHDLSTLVGTIAASLRTHGITPGTMVMVCLPKGIPQVATVLALGVLGAAYIPVSAQWPERRLGSVVKRTESTLVVCEDPTAAAFPDGVTTLTYDELLRTPGMGVPSTAPRPASDHLAYAIFTSGSTGEPKGVAIRHRQALATIDAINDLYSMASTDRVLAMSELHFDLSVWDIFGMLGAGGCVVLPTPGHEKDPGHWLDLIAQQRITVWNSVPALLEMLVEYAEHVPSAGESLSSLRFVILSGDWIPVTLPERLKALVPDVHVTSAGGATEAAIWSIHHDVEPGDSSLASIPYGRPLPEQSFLILDESLKPVPCGQPGDLYIAGAGVAEGYIGAPDITAKSFIIHPELGEKLYRTGDLGMWRNDGVIIFLGRSDRQVKVGGYRIELAEIEAALERLSDVRQAVVLAEKNHSGRLTLIAHVSAQGALDKQDVMARLGREVPDYMVPRSYVFHDGLPLTSNGKVDMKALAAGGSGTTPTSSTPSQTLAPSTAPDQVEQSTTAGHAPSDSPAESSTSPYPQVLRDALPPETDIDQPPLAAGLGSLDLVRLANAVEDFGCDRPRIAELTGAASVRELLDTWISQSGSNTATLNGVPHPTVDKAPKVPEPQVAEPVGTSPQAETRAAHSAGDPSPLLGQAAGVLSDLGQAHGLPSKGFATLLTSIASSLDDIANACREYAATCEDTTDQTAVAPAAPVETAVAPITQVEDYEPFALSPMQLAYLVGRAPDQFGRKVAPHYYTDALVADLDVSTFCAAWAAVVAAHPMLRTVVDGSGTQRTLPSVDADAAVTVADLRHHTAEVRDAHLADHRAQASHRIVPHDVAPMVRWHVMLLPGGAAWLALDVDLLFLDASSACTMVADVQAAYDALRGGTVPPKPSAGEGHPYREWAQAHHARQPDAAAMEASARISPRGPRLLRPYPSPTSRWQRLRAVSADNAMPEVTALAAQRSTTVTGLLCQALCRAIPPSGDAPSVIITSQDRPHDHAGVVGDYTKTVVVALDETTVGHAILDAVDLATGPNAVDGLDTLRQLRRTHDNVELLMVVSSGLGADTSDMDASQLLDGWGSTQFAISQTPNVGLDVQLFSVGGQLRVVMDYDTALIDPDVVASVFDAWVACLASWGVALTPVAVPSLTDTGQAAPTTPTVSQETLSPAASFAAEQPAAAPIPTGGTRAIVVGAIAEALRQEPSAIQENVSWFDMGATSLDVVDVHRRLVAQGYSLTVVDLFTHTTVSALTRFLGEPDGQSAAANSGPAVDVSPSSTPALPTTTAPTQPVVDIAFPTPTARQRPVGLSAAERANKRREALTEGPRR